MFVQRCLGLRFQYRIRCIGAPVDTKNSVQDMEGIPEDDTAQATSQHDTGEEPAAAASDARLSMQESGVGPLASSAKKHNCFTKSR